MPFEQPYRRHISVAVGPLAEYLGGGNAAQAVLMEADGTPNGLRIKFDVNKHIISTASPSVVSIYNLSAGTRAALQKPGVKIAVSAGWENTAKSILFSGSLLNSVSFRQGADIVTELYSLAGWGGASRALSTLTLSEGTSVRSAVLALASTLEGVTVDEKLVDISSSKFSSQGYSFAGLSTEGLDKLSRVYGFSWWIDQGVFYALDDSRGNGSTAIPLISGDGGTLIRAEPMLCSPFQLQAGVSIACMFDPAIKAGSLVQLDSQVNPSLNRKYKVHTLNHAGDSHSSQWMTRIQSLVFNNY